MNTGQMMITVGAMVILSLVILRVTNNFFSTNSVLFENKYAVLAVSLATSVIEEATNKSFDENTDTSNASLLTELTSPGSLGADGETYKLFDDFDDFDGFIKLTGSDTTVLSAPFKIECKVRYIDPAVSVDSVNYKTWHKRITVTVTSPFMRDAVDKLDTIKLSSIYSYWYFR